MLLNAGVSMHLCVCVYKHVTNKKCMNKKSSPTCLLLTVQLNCFFNTKTMSFSSV